MPPHVVTRLFPLQLSPLKPTYTGSNMTALRYCLENHNFPGFTSVLTDTNLQSFLVLVQP